MSIPLRCLQFLPPCFSWLCQQKFSGGKDEETVGEEEAKVLGPEHDVGHLDVIAGTAESSRAGSVGRGVPYEDRDTHVRCQDNGAAGQSLVPFLHSRLGGGVGANSRVLRTGSIYYYANFRGRDSETVLLPFTRIRIPAALQAWSPIRHRWRACKVGDVLYEFLRAGPSADPRIEGRVDSRNHRATAQSITIKYAVLWIPTAAYEGQQQ
ncbi:hypothetical protein B0H16DRAFT_657548 [Mycena metata]|uniref:Uncharacterized protein n=1 Tax=Mycena metata TaxID=1033252 RepID=A0AAD7IWS1_9AGAR|nr:hypothetical protein B0H16DRAFT_815779 [Mycena metata]KAJ7757972.1 hypothetical protein B0H16DRAFT_657548 [Mycena metata]